MEKHGNPPPGSPGLPGLYADYPGSTGSFDELLVDSRFKPMNSDDLEDPEQYSMGGFHPVHLGDLLGPNSRYKVLNKLGNGGLSTVWLCRDLETKTYIALKLLIAGASKEDCAELKLMRKARNMEQFGDSQIGLPSTHFWVDGPNGRHLCLLLPVLGPRVSDIWNTFDDPGTLSRSIALQVVNGVSFLHKNGLCHGDLRPANILLRISNLDSLSEEQLIKEFGEPEEDPLLTASGEDHELLSAPKYLVRPINMTAISRQYLTDQVCIIDFGESYDPLTPPELLGIPPTYSSPELLFHELPGIASDIWALACTLFEIRSGQQLFQGMFGDEDDIIMQMVQLFGKFPEPWWSSWVNRDRWFDEKGKPNTYLADGRPAADLVTLETILAEGYHYTYYAGGLFSGGEGERKSFTIPKDEITIFADLLGQMLKYNPKERITAAKAADHEWFRIIKVCR